MKGAKEFWKKATIVFNPEDMDDARRNSKKELTRKQMADLNNKVCEVKMFEGEEDIDPGEEYDCKVGPKRFITICGKYLKPII